MRIFVINKAKFEIIRIESPYAILRSLKTSEQLVYKIDGCIQYSKQFGEVKNTNNLQPQLTIF